MLSGVLLEPLRRIPGAQGAVYHALKRSDPAFIEFGEVYFTTVNSGAIKGWKRHRRMHSNLVVPVGEVRIVMFDDRDTSSTRGQWADVPIGESHYARLTIPAGVWFAFQGVGMGLNLMMNLASIPHDPAECDTTTLDDPRFAAHVW